MRFDGTGIRNERNFENGSTDMIIPPEKLNVCILRRKNDDSILFSRNLRIVTDYLHINRISRNSIDVRKSVRYNIVINKGDDVMTAISVTKARENIYQILSDVNTSSQPITITNNRGKNGVLISEEDWNAIQETLYLNSIPGMTESIIESGKEPLEECSVYDPDEEW